MSFIITITLSGTTGGNTGPFDLYSCTGATCAGTAFVSGIAKSDLLTGYTTSTVPDGTTIIRCKSNNGVCANYTDLTITGLPGPSATPTQTPSHTPTPTSTPLTPIYSYKLGTGATATEACINYDPDNSNTYWSYCAPSGFTNGCMLYKVGGYPLSTLADNGYYANSGYTWYVVSGDMVGQAVCTYTPTPTPTPTRHGLGWGIYTGSTFANSSLTCAFDLAHTYTGITTAYLGPDVTVPVIGDYFYNDNYLTPGNTFVGNGNYYGVKRAVPTLAIYAVKISSGGEILDVVAC